MIHKVNVPPVSVKLLRAIMAMQRALLAAVEPAAITSASIDGAWISNQLIALGIDTDWANGFAQRDNRIANLKVIADLPQPVKAQLLQDFDYDIAFELSFGDAALRPYLLKGCTAVVGCSPVNKKAIADYFKDFLTSFYSPEFYRNYGYVMSDNGRFIVFNREKFIEEFHDANNDLRVCPLCDGYPTNEQVDHFYPKADYPALSCHPLNLIPICGECNGTTNKGQKDITQAPGVNQSEG
jgi:hypothetical protein